MERSRDLLREFGRELRSARINRGLSQITVARAIGVSQAQVSLIERGNHPTISILTLAGFAAAVGLDLSIRGFPSGQPVRDKAHIALLSRFKNAVGDGWRLASEVPLPIPGDKRAWDRLMRGFGHVIGVGGEMHPTDMQELGRRLAVKKRDGGVDRLILVMPNTRWCRQVVAMNELAAAFPIAGQAALEALRNGRDPCSDAIVLI
ncbi:MAG TPA: helix-turn-helix domain-containing protein [Candidatus Limnocylindrales bacterium]|nr:helix-turn-helix domain-containing protein [Candidatus Limnocylindrales bacterium]